MTNTAGPKRSILAVAASSLAIRGGSLVLRTVLVLVLARVMTTQEYGVFGLLQSSLSIGLYLVGLDVYVITTRRVPTQSRERTRETIGLQAIIHGATYLTVLPLYVLVLAWWTLPVRYAAPFGLLLLLEHLSFEAVRLLTALGRPIQANLLVFARGFLWIVPFLVGGLLNPLVFSITGLLTFWISGLGVALGVSVWLLHREKVLPTRGTRIDWTGILPILAGAGLFLMASVSSKTVFFSGRYSLGAVGADVDVGIYTFFQNIVMLVDVFVYTAVTMILLPQVLSARESGNHRVFSERLLLLQGGVWWGTVIPLVGLFLVRHPLVALFNKPELSERMDLFAALIGVSMMTGLAQVFHYQLYVSARDRPLVVAALAGLVACVVSHAFLVRPYGMLGAAAATAIGIAVTVTLQAVAASPTNLAFFSPMVLVKLSRSHFQIDSRDESGSV